jgi:hypothetical protein
MNLGKTMEYLDQDVQEIDASVLTRARHKSIIEGDSSNHLTSIFVITAKGSKETNRPLMFNKMKIPLFSQTPLQTLQQKKLPSDKLPPSF